MNRGVEATRGQWEITWKKCTEKKTQAKLKVAKTISTQEENKIDEVLELPKGEREKNIMKVIDQIHQVP